MKAAMKHRNVEAFEHDAIPIVRDWVQIMLAVRSNLWSEVCDYHNSLHKKVKSCTKSFCLNLGTTWSSNWIKCVNCIISVITLFICSFKWIMYLFTFNFLIWYSAFIILNSSGANLRFNFFLNFNFLELQIKKKLWMNELKTLDREEH